MKEWKSCKQISPRDEFCSGENSVSGVNVILTKFCGDMAPKKSKSKLESLTNCPEFLELIESSELVETSEIGRDLNNFTYWTEKYKC